MKKNGIVHPGIALVLSILFALAISVPAFSETAPANIVFTSINANESFPEVSVQVKVLDAENNFVPGLNADQFSLNLVLTDFVILILPINIRARHGPTRPDTLSLMAEEYKQYLHIEQCPLGPSNNT